MHNELRPLQPPPRGGRAALGLFIAACLVFAALAADLLLHGPVTAADAGISRWFHEYATPALTFAMRAVSELHATATILVLSACAVAALFWRGQREWIAPLVVSVPGGLWLNSAIKGVFQRPRPAFEHPLVTLATYSFPSGHTVTATVSWGFLLVWLHAHRATPRGQAPVAALAAVMVAFTALSRIYLGAHYLSDVLAATAEGVAWLALCFLVVAPWSRRARP